MARIGPIAGTVAALAIWPLRALASSGGGAEAAWGNTEAGALLGIAAAFAWHHVTRRRPNIVHRWQQMHLGDRLPILRLGERLHAFDVRATLASVLHIGRHPEAAAQARRVLVIDDDADVRTALGEILSSQGFAVSEAADGFEGLRRAREDRPDVILLDLMMPKMDGFAFRAEQRTDPALEAIPVVVISAAGPEEQSQGFGAAAYLHKPFDLRVLIDAVDRCAVPA